MREHERNLTGSCVSQHGPRCHELAEWRTQSELWTFEMEKVTEEYGGCLLMVRVYFISI